MQETLSQHVSSSQHTSKGRRYEAPSSYLQKESKATENASKRATQHQLFKEPLKSLKVQQTKWRRLDCSKTKYIDSGLTTTLLEEALLSLYHDRIRPLLPDLLQRVKSQIKTNGEIDQTKKRHKKLMVDIKVLEDFILTECQTTILLLGPSGHQYKKRPTSSLITSNYNRSCEAVLSNPPRYFQGWVDPHNIHNPYSTHIWRSLWAFLLSRLGDFSTPATAEPESPRLMPYQWKGGRYGLAVELQKSEFPALSQLVLGELCHLVQLAINGGLLAYEKSVLQPVAACGDLCSLILRLGQDSNEDDACNQSSCFESSDVKPRHPFETPTELAICLDELLKEDKSGIVLAQLKKALYARYHKEFMPERWGFRKITECLTMCPELRAICVLKIPDPATHRLVLLHRKFADSTLNDHLFTSQQPAKLEGPPSPGSVSTAACSEISASTKSPEPITIAPVTAAPNPPIPFKRMVRAAASLTPITFLYWALQPSVKRFKFSDHKVFSSNNCDNSIDYLLSSLPQTIIMSLTPAAHTHHCFHDHQPDSIFQGYSSFFHQHHYHNHTNCNNYLAQEPSSGPSYSNAYWDCY